MAVSRREATTLPVPRRLAQLVRTILRAERTEQVADGAAIPRSSNVRAS
jgi:hypothetical protein